MQVTFIKPSDASNADIAANIRAAGARILTVVFVKKDGSVRRMNCQLPAVKTHCVGSERGKKQSASFHSNTENDKYMHVFDMQKRAIRMINLDTVLTVKSGGQITRYRPLHVLRHSLVAA